MIITSTYSFYNFSIITKNVCKMNATIFNISLIILFFLLQKFLTDKNIIIISSFNLTYPVKI